jgi:threonine dehydrogenase-like Zn-dependent dehydrogenase
MRAVILDAEWCPRPGYRPSARELETHRAEMACAVWRHARFAVAEVPDPAPARNEVLLAVRVSGVCGSDTHCYERDGDGYVRFSGPLRAPCVIGHEYAAEIVEVGADVKGLRRGELVTAEGMLYCGRCEPCRRGFVNQCVDLEMVGFSAPGAFTSLITAKARSLWSLEALAERLGDAARALELGALVEPIAVAFNGLFVTAGGFAPGAHVAVFGCGPIGLAAIALARAAGAATIAAFEPIAERRTLALTLGADEAWDPSAVAPAEALDGLSRGAGTDMLVEAAGAALDTVPEIERAIAPGGTVLYLGRTGLRAPLGLDVLVSRAAAVFGSRGHAGSGCFPRVLRLLERGRLPVDAMITSRLPFERALSAVERSCARSDGKILLHHT